MQIIITEEAGKKLTEKTAGKDGYLKLVYDIEDCGCAVNGVPVLWFVKELSGDEVEVKTNKCTIYMEKDKLVFFDETMSLDFSVTANCFQLKSPSQYLNPRMSLVDKTK
ncbi:iron-sulfur cluster biosynthesis family protein [Neobacillus sp. LXY-4]|uniref:iron-sulfur cluster biosynthesis family protein n=1 Tax=Neobacillus sp. LXY-4 TaxID=3379826 RepID=UPI003EE1456E